MYIDYRFNKNIVTQVEQEALRKHPEYKLDGNTCVVLRHYYTTEEIERAKMFGLNLEGEGKADKIQSDHAFIRALRREFLQEAVSKYKLICDYREESRVEIPKENNLEKLLQMKREIEEEINRIEEVRKEKVKIENTICELEEIVKSLENQTTTKFTIKADEDKKASVTFRIVDEQMALELNSQLRLFLEKHIQNWKERL